MLLADPGRRLELRCYVTYLTDETAQNASKIFIANVQATPSHRPSSGHKAHVRVNGIGQSRSSAFVPNEKTEWFRVFVCRLAFAH